MQGVQAVALIVPLFLLVFASAYYILEHDQPGNFSVRITRTDALYFVVAVFSTVGFGDITPVTQGARVLVTIQMIGDLLILGVVFRIILTAVRRGRQQPARDQVESSPPKGSVRPRMRRRRGSD